MHTFRLCALNISHPTCKPHIHDVAHGQKSPAARPSNVHASHTRRTSIGRKRPQQGLNSINAGRPKTHHIKSITTNQVALQTINPTTLRLGDSRNMKANPRVRLAFASPIAAVSAMSSVGSAQGYVVGVVTLLLLKVLQC